MNALWILSRSSGLIATVFLSATVVIGILSARDSRMFVNHRFLTRGVHRRVAMISCALLAVHIAAVVADSYVDIPLSAIAIPFTSTYQTVPIALGTLSVDVLLAVMLSSLLWQKMPRRIRPQSHQVWRIIHVTVYLAWPLAILHGLLAGTDDLLTLAIAGIGGLAVGCVALMRAFGHWQQESPSPADGTRRTTTQTSPSTTASRNRDRVGAGR